MTITSSSHPNAWLAICEAEGGEGDTSMVELKGMLGLPYGSEIVDIHRHEVFRTNQIVIAYKEPLT